MFLGNELGPDTMQSLRLGYCLLVDQLQVLRP